MNIKKYSGCRDNRITKREIEHQKMARTIAEEGIVLLHNNGVLPLEIDKNIALYGSGARKTIKGGSGSGDVNERYSVSICEGLENAGFIITSGKWLDEYDTLYENKREEWKNSILDQGNNDTEKIIRTYINTPFKIPYGRLINNQDIAESKTDTAIYVISRTAGEGKDRENVEGDYKLAETERKNIHFLCSSYKNVILIINSGGIVDLSIMDDEPVAGLLYVSQPGMEGGNAIANLLMGKVTPSGKLTDTFAEQFEDYPDFNKFRDTNKNEEYYSEGIFVGYRYFDSFNKEVRYPFGYGLSYTDFKWEVEEIHPLEEAVQISVSVKNIGQRFAGKEILQVYASAPQGKLVKEYQRLVGYEKTNLLLPGEEEMLVFNITYNSLGSYSTKKASWILEKGDYLIRIGNCSKNTDIVLKINMNEDFVVEQDKNLCQMQKEIHEIKLMSGFNIQTDDNAPTIKVDTSLWNTRIIDYNYEETFDKNTDEKVKLLSDEQLASLVIGCSDSNNRDTIGASSRTIPGAAGETNGSFQGTPYNINYIVMADGPAGLRLKKHYQVSQNGEIQKSDILSSIEGGMFAPEKYSKDSTDYYQYCTALPVGTLLAQTYNVKMLEKIGKMISEEMSEFGINVWLAPGINIHRNPLCGRNYEYYSEDPYVSGVTATAITRGVQSNPKHYVAVKHFACNNCENNRKKSDSIISERTLREIYLKGFEYVVKNGKPGLIMSAYNKINGIHAANNYDLCTNILRKEWGFSGVVVSDWTTTYTGGSDAALCISSGNDLIMPGYEEDRIEIIDSLSGKRQIPLKRKELQISVSRIIQLVSKCN